MFRRCCSHFKIIFIECKSFENVFYRMRSLFCCCRNETNLFVQLLTNRAQRSR
jgi:hypothetical protein